jgi:hypothetical protein
MLCSIQENGVRIIATTLPWVRLAKGSHNLTRVGMRCQYRTARRLKRPFARFPATVSREHLPALSAQWLTVASCGNVCSLRLRLLPVRVSKKINPNRKNNVMPPANLRTV